MTSRLPSVALQSDLQRRGSRLPQTPKLAGGREAAASSQVIELIPAMVDLAVQLWRDDKLDLDGLIPTPSLRAEWTQPDYRAALERYYARRYS